MSNIRPSGSNASWNPKMPTTKLMDAPLLQPGAMDDPECTPGKDSPFEPFKRGSRKPSGPFGQYVSGNGQT